MPPEDGLSNPTAGMAGDRRNTLAPAAGGPLGVFGGAVDVAG